MPFKYNPLTRQMDLVEGVGTGHPACDVVDDDVIVIGMPSDTAMALITETGGHGNSMVWLDGVTPFINDLVSDAGAYDFTTGVLTGTTGVDGNVTLSVDNAGNLYIENRSGATLKFAVSLLNEANQ